LIVSPEDLGKLPWNAKARDADFAGATYRGVRVDLRLRSNALFDEVARTARAMVSFQGRPVVTATREGLLLLKLYALPSLYRTANLARAALYETDVLMLHQGAAVDDAALLARLRPHLSGYDIAELGRILEEQRARTRFALGRGMQGAPCRADYAFGSFARRRMPRILTRGPRPRRCCSKRGAARTTLRCPAFQASTPDLQSLDRDAWRSGRRDYETWTRGLPRWVGRAA
jgi:hypothetical protein